MSQENVEIARRACEAAWRRPQPDFDTLNALAHPDHEMFTVQSLVEGEAIGEHEVSVSGSQASARRSAKLGNVRSRKRGPLPTIGSSSLARYTSVGSAVVSPSSSVSGRS
jgi:hypothetical protein